MTSRLSNMKRTYFCPKCNATLNPGTKVVLTALTPRKSGLVLLSPQPGNYAATVAPELGLKHGERVTFQCPVCSAELTSPFDPKLAELEFRATNGVEGTVAFSQRYGEHATFVMQGEAVQTYGENVDDYEGVNFFGEGHR